MDYKKAVEAALKGNESAFSALYESTYNMGSVQISYRNARHISLSYNLPVTILL